MGVLTDWTLVPSRAWRTGTTSRPRPRRHTPRRSSPSPSRPPQRNVDPQKRHLRMARTQHRSFFGFLDSLGVMMNVFIFSWFTKDFFSRFSPFALLPLKLTFTLDESICSSPAFVSNRSCHLAFSTGRFFLFARGPFSPWVIFSLLFTPSS